MKGANPANKTMDGELSEEYFRWHFEDIKAQMELLEVRKKRLVTLRHQFRIEQRSARNAAETAKIEETKDRLAKTYKIPRDVKFDNAWRIAWDLGHASGFDEVENHFADLVDLIK